jgi:catalase
MKKGTKDFSQAASSHYKVMTPDEKEDLRKRRLQSTKSFSTREIKQEGRSIFKSIHLKVSYELRIHAPHT